MLADDAEFLTMFGRRVRVLRTARGLSQEELADLAGMTRNKISSIERAAQDPGVTVVRRLSLALAVPVSVLVDEEADSERLALRAVDDRQPGR